MAGVDLVIAVTQAALDRRFGPYGRPIDVVSVDGSALRGKTATRRIRIVAGGQFVVLLQLGDSASRASTRRSTTAAATAWRC